MTNVIEARRALQPLADALDEHIRMNELTPGGWPTPPLEPARMTREEAIESIHGPAAAAAFRAGRVSQVPPQIVRDIAEVQEQAPDDWRNTGPEPFIEDFLRHTLCFMEDPRSLDDESGKPHYKHMACCLAFIAEFFKT